MSDKPRWQKLEQALTLLDTVERKLALYHHQAERLQTIVDELTEQETRYQLDRLLTTWQGEPPTVTLWSKAGVSARGNFIYCLELRHKKIFVNVDKDGCLFLLNKLITIEQLQEEFYE